MTTKCKQDAFYFYKLKFVEENEGKVFKRGITDIDVAARQSWRSMTLQQRDPFEDLAKQAAPVVKQPTKVDEKVSIEAQNNKIVTEIVRRSIRSSNIRTEQYYFISANIFCEMEQDKYLPAEMALLKFTLQNGVVKTYHTYIDPGTIPLDCKFTALELSETTHRLPLPPNAMGEKNFAAIQQEIDKFIGNAQPCKQGFIPLFTLAENVRMIELICEDLHDSTNEASYCRYKILPIDQLLFRLKTSVGRKQQMQYGNSEPQFNSIEDATSQLNREKYKYLCEIACEYHEKKDCSQYCCLSDVMRWAYVFSELICDDLKISLVGGKHFPIEVEDSPGSVDRKNSPNNSKVAAGVPAAAAHREYNLNADLNPLRSVDRKRAPNNSKVATDVAEAPVHHEQDLNADLDSLQLVDRKCAQNESKPDTAVPAAAVHSDRKYNLNRHSDTQDVVSSSSGAQSLPAKGNRKQRNYFAEDDLVRRSAGKGKGVKRG